MHKKYLATCAHTYNRTYTQAHINTCNTRITCMHLCGFVHIHMYPLTHILLPVDGSAFSWLDINYLCSHVCMHCVCFATNWNVHCAASANRGRCKQSHSLHSARWPGHLPFNLRTHSSICINTHNDHPNSEVISSPLDPPQLQPSVGKWHFRDAAFASRSLGARRSEFQKMNPFHPFSVGSCSSLYHRVLYCNMFHKLH